MKCLNCGCENSHYLCDDCIRPDILERIFNQIRFYKPETCENPYLAEFVAGLSEKYAERDAIPDILSLFDFDITEYYYCLYYRMRRDGRFEDAAISYLSTHALTELSAQQVMFDLIENYLPNDFVKPGKWCETVAQSADFCCELYAVAAKYYAMIGEYDLSDFMVSKASAICEGSENDRFLFYSPENMAARLKKQKEDTLRYRTKKPYWPATEDRRRAVAMFYDEKGIAYPRIESKPVKVTESDFVPIHECFEDSFRDYSAFWCAEAFSLSAAKSIYQIAAVRVRDGQITDSFQAFIRPWDGAAARKDAAKKAGVPLVVIEGADDVDQVMTRFFDFVGSDILVSTGALGNQAKLISRAARYTGMKEIKNEFYDLLDLAADTSSEFDLEHNTREYLLSCFSLQEGNDSLEKAQCSMLLYDALINYGE